MQKTVLVVIGLVVVVIAALAVGITGGIRAATYKDKMDRLSQSKSALREKVSQVEGELASARQEARTAEGQIGVLSEENANMSQRLRRIDDIHKVLRSLRAKAAALQGEISTAKHSSFGDGIWQVGTDIVPGLYRSPGGSDCYWAQLNSASTNDIANNGGFSANQTLQISSGFFQTDGCGTWHKIG